MSEIWFWQCIVSPHMAGLAVALAGKGCRVTYVAEQTMTADRAKQGWAVPALPGVELVYATSGATVAALVRNAPADAVHICQGIRSNGLVAGAQHALAMRGAWQWVVMETVNDAVWYGALKRAEYGRLFRTKVPSLQGVLATGHRTTSWVADRGVPSTAVFPFAYFLPNVQEPDTDRQRKPGPYRFVFAGRLIPLKRVDWLLNALADLVDQSFELCVVGAGPEAPALGALAARKLDSRVRWLGQLPSSGVPTVMVQADCLVLPSIHDGWGAVASEALMVGTPVICSDACGVAGVVNASGAGGVFPVNDNAELGRLLANQLAVGIIGLEKRQQLASWATCLGATAGADYLLEILGYQTSRQGARPVVPWLREKSLCVD